VKKSRVDYMMRVVGCGNMTRQCYDVVHPPISSGHNMVPLYDHQSSIQANNLKNKVFCNGNLHTYGQDVLYIFIKI